MKKLTSTERTRLQRARNQIDLVLQADETPLGPNPSLMLELRDSTRIIETIVENYRFAV